MPEGPTASSRLAAPVGGPAASLEPQCPQMGVTRRSRADRGCAGRPRQARRYATMSPVRFPVHLLVLTAVAAALTVPAQEASAAPAAYSFAPSGLDSASQDVAAYSPFRDASGARPVLLGGDT